YLFCFFFFQAEDGIRDFHVTGVQTCALPIWTKKFNFSTIDALAPDLIVGNKEENYKEGIDALRERYPVWMSDILDLKDAYSMIEGIGMLVGKKAEAMRIISEIDQGFARVVPKIRKSALYLIWQDPYMGVGSRTFIHEM